MNKRLPRALGEVYPGVCTMVGRCTQGVYHGREGGIYTEWYTQGRQGAYTQGGIPRVGRVYTMVGIPQGVQGVHHGGYISGV